jgi:hypothetical protein
MTGFFVPIFHSLGSFGNEKVLIGLLVVTPEKVWYAYSQKKLKLVKQILGAASYELAKATLSQIGEKVNTENKKSPSYSGLVDFQNPVFGKDYFEYLKKYANNSLLFDSAQELNFEINEESFQKLYQNWVGDTDLADVNPKPNFHTHIQSLLKKYPIKDKADVGLKLDPYQLPGLNGDTFVNLIAQNGAVMAMETVDFTSSMTNISLTLNSFEILVAALKGYSEAKGLKSGKYKLMLKKPKAGSEQENLLNLFYSQKKELYTLLEEKEIESVIEELHQEEYQKFSIALNQ